MGYKYITYTIIVKPAIWR